MYHKGWIWICLVAVLGVPALVSRLSGTHLTPELAALLFGTGIVGAAFLLTWASEVLEIEKLAKSSNLGAFKHTDFWQPVDMAATANEQSSYSRVSVERLQESFGRPQIYGYQSDGKTKVRNEVYRDQQYYSPIFNPYGSYYRNRNYTPYGFRPTRRSTILIFGDDN